MTDASESVPTHAIRYRPASWAVSSSGYAVGWCNSALRRSAPLVLSVASFSASDPVSE